MNEQILRDTIDAMRRARWYWTTGAFVGGLTLGAVIVTLLYALAIETP